MRIFIFLIFFCLFGDIYAQIEMPAILSMRERAAVLDEILEERIKTVLPDIMRRNGIDLWVIISREYNEDPIIKTLLPATWMSARRRTILLIHDPGAGKDLECYAVARYSVGSVFKKAWDKEKQPDQWARVRELVESLNVKKIGVNTSTYFALADGLVKTDHDAFLDALAKADKQKVVSAERVAIGWLETRSEREMMIYPQICRIAHAIILEGLSEKVIQPGVSSTNDVVWYYRERIRELKLSAWFHPTVAVQRHDNDSFEHLRNFSNRPDEMIIQPGDLLHIDFGITYLGLNTDTQHHAYVLKAGEKEAPAYLQQAFKIGNRLQSILTEQFTTGVTGNEMLAAALKQAEKEGIKATIYSHPIGFHGHGAGPTIGLWDQQGGVPHNGDYPLFANTAYSIELNAAVELKEWGKTVRIMLEEDAFFDGKEVRYIDGRQTELWLIPRPVKGLD